MESNHFQNCYKTLRIFFLNFQYFLSNFGLRISDKHGCETIKLYVDSEIADNSMPPDFVRYVISRVAIKMRISRYTYRFSQTVLYTRQLW